MTDESLTRALIDMIPAEWYALLNERVFFWVGEERLGKLLNAYRHRDNLVLVLDTAKVMARYAARTTLSPINSGFSARYPQPRGRDTFRPIAEYPFDGMGEKTRRSGQGRGGMRGQRRRGERHGGAGRNGEAEVRKAEARKVECRRQKSEGA